MLLEVSAIGTNARSVMERDLSGQFTVKEGQGLNDVVTEVLNDQQLFTYLAKFLPENHGVRLGSFNFYDDTPVTAEYGIIMGLEIPRNLQIFTNEDLKFGYTRFSRRDGLFGYKKFDPENFPTPQRFANEVDTALANISKYLIELPK